MSCKHSLPGRLWVGAAGRTHHEYNIRFRDAPAAGEGVRVAPNTRFEVIGGPRCAWLGANELMWWQVRILSGSAAGRVGWFAESGLNANGTMIYNLFPN
ncbi:MAG: hypothetical protein SNJ58_13800 [Aggregatilineales bacterium]